MKRDMPGAFIRESSMHDRKGGEDMAENIHHPETENHAAGWNEHAEEQEVMDLRRAIEESRWLEIDIRSRTEQMISLREAADRMSSALPGIRSGAGGRHDFMERAVVSMVDLEREISEEICRLMKLRERMMVCIRGVEKPESRTVLQLRYLNGKSWQEIADLLGCSLHTVYRRHRTAMRELEQMSPEESQNAQAEQGNR